MRKLKPAVKNGKARSAEHGVDDGVTVDGQGRGMGRWRVFRSHHHHHHHHQMEPAGSVTATPENVRGARKEARGLEREREREKERERGLETLRRWNECHAGT